MCTRRDEIRWPALVALTCAFLILAGVAKAREVPKIHPPKIHLQRGIVTAVRSVTAYAAALGASTSRMGEIYCYENSSRRIKRTSIFRVETASRYFDLSKVCNDDSSGYDGYGFLYGWSIWEHLRIGETVVFRIVKRTTQLSIGRCEEVGILSKSFGALSKSFGKSLDPAQRFQKLLLSTQKDTKIYKSRCIYPVIEAYVRVKRPSYYIYSNKSAPSGYHYDLWTFRVVGSGPISQANIRRIGLVYSESLPPWD